MLITLLQLQSLKKTKENKTNLVKSLIPDIVNG